MTIRKIPVRKSITFAICEKYFISLIQALVSFDFVEGILLAPSSIQENLVKKSPQAKFTGFKICDCNVSVCSGNPFGGKPFDPPGDVASLLSGDLKPGFVLLSKIDVVREGVPIDQIKAIVVAFISKGYPGYVCFSKKDRSSVPLDDVVTLKFFSEGTDNDGRFVGDKVKYPARVSLIWLNNKKGKEILRPVRRMMKKLGLPKDLYKQL